MKSGGTVTINNNHINDDFMTTIIVKLSFKFISAIVSVNIQPS